MYFDQDTPKPIRKRRRSYFRFVSRRSLDRYSVERRSEAETMKTFVCAVLVGLLCLPPSQAKQSSPKVQVYSRLQGEVGKENTLICHVTEFHPPEINIELLRNSQVMAGAHQTDLAFEKDWYYHLTKHVPFTPQKGEAFACNVTHMGIPKIYIWEADV